MQEDRQKGRDAFAPLDHERARVSRAHWRDNLGIMALLLSVWFCVSYGLGIVLVEPLNRILIGGFPLGFWFAQQGAIYVFIALILIYALWMDRVDRRHGVEGPPADAGSAPASRRQADP